MLCHCLHWPESRLGHGLSEPQRHHLRLVALLISQSEHTLHLQARVLSRLELFTGAKHNINPIHETVLVMPESQVYDCIIDLLWLNRLHRLNHGDSLFLGGVESSTCVTTLAKIFLLFVINEVFALITVLKHGLPEPRRVYV